MILFNRHYITPLRRKGILIPLMFLALWVLGFYSPIISSYFYATRWPVSMVLFGLSCFVIMKRIKTIKFGFLSISLIFLITLMLISTIYSFSPTYTLLRSLAAVILIVTAFSFAVTRIKELDDIKRSFYALLFLYVLLCVAFFYGSIFDPFAVYSDRLQGSEQFKATGGGNMLVSAFLFILWWWKFSRPMYKPFLAVFLLIIVIAVVATRSRVPIAGALLLCPIAWSIVRGKKLTHGLQLFIIMMMLVSGLIFVRPGTTEFLRIESKGQDISIDEITTGRFSRWKSLVEEGKQRPFIGHGFGTSRYIDWYIINGSFSIMEWSSEVNNSVYQKLSHSQHIQLFYELGLLGFFTFEILFLYIIFLSWKILRFPSTPISLMLKMIALSVLYHLLDSFSHDGLFTIGTPVSYLFWFKVGILASGYSMLVRARLVNSAQTRNNLSKLNSLST